MPSSSHAQTCWRGLQWSLYQALVIAVMVVHRNTNTDIGLEPRVVVLGSNHVKRKIWGAMREEMETLRDRQSIVE